MNMIRTVGYVSVAAFLLVAALAVISSVPAVGAQVDPSDYSELRTAITKVAVQKIEQPEWLRSQLAAEAAAKASAGSRQATDTMTVAYDVSTRGAISASFAEFKQLANQTLNDPRGWSRMNVRFVEVPSGGQFSLVLASAAEVGAVPGCGAAYSCRSGRYVLINQDRWMGATPSWNSAGGSLRDYRHMVVNHETGHWLGLGHSQCGGSGQSAPVMQQQSIDLQGCGFNPWPLANELTSPQLGI